MGAAPAKRLRLSREFPWAAFGVVLRTLRRDAQLTQRELEGRAGLSPASVSSYELGKSRPSQKTVEALLAALDVSLPEVVSALGGLSGRDSSAGARRARSTKSALGQLDFFLVDLSAMAEEIVQENQERNDPSPRSLGIIGEKAGKIRKAGC
jgi:transcriptional regulator with XRE-family HTH domain